MALLQPATSSYMVTRERDCGLWENHPDLNIAPHTHQRYMDGSIAACKAACDARSSCGGFSYVSGAGDPNSPQHRCWFRRDTSLCQRAYTCPKCDGCNATNRDCYTKVVTGSLTSQAVPKWDETMWDETQGIDCGLWEDHPDLFIASTGARYHDGTLAECKRLCGSSLSCGGFAFVQGRANPSAGRCWFRRDTTCKMEANANRACYHKRGHQAPTPKCIKYNAWLVWLHTWGPFVGGSLGLVVFGGLWLGLRRGGCCPGQQQAEGGVEEARSNKESSLSVHVPLGPREAWPPAPGQ